jgi:hypothetical protein
LRPHPAAKEAAIGPDDTAGSLYYNALRSASRVLDAVDLIASGTAPRLPQDEAMASYDPLCRDEHAQVHWNRPVAEVYNLIRGCDPQPGAYVVRAGDKVRFYDARRADTADAVGVIAAIDERGIVVGAGGGSIAIGRLRVGDKKLAAREAATALALKGRRRPIERDFRSRFGAALLPLCGAVGKTPPLHPKAVANHRTQSGSRPPVRSSTPAPPARLSASTIWPASTCTHAPRPALRRRSDAHHHRRMSSPSPAATWWPKLPST